MTNGKFAEFIVEERKVKGYTQSQLARRLFVTDKAVSKWERGLNYPDITTIRKLAEVFEITIIELLNGERKMDDKNTNKEEVIEAVNKTLDFSKTLMQNQKKNYINQGMILVIVLLLVVVSYQGYNQMFGSFGTSISSLNKRIADAEALMEQLQTKSEDLNVFGNGIYYCDSPASTEESIEFVSADVIRVYNSEVPESMVHASNSYFRIKKIGINKFTITGDVIRDDTYGDVNYELVKSTWELSAGLQLFKVIEISADHKMLYYGNTAVYNYFQCTLNVKPV